MKFIQKIIIVLFLFTFSLEVNAISDSLKIKNLEFRMEQLNNSLEEVRRDELTYQIEKDLIRETYSSNYERTNTVISIVLVVLGILGFLGFKGISTTKKEYEIELNKLRKIEAEFNLKAKSFDDVTTKFNTEIKEITRINEEQNNKIKFLELKEKVSKLIEENRFTTALEYVNAGLEINSEDITLHNSKSCILIRLNQLNEALTSLEIAMKIDENDNTTIVNIVECLHFLNEIDRANEIIQLHKKVIENKAEGGLVHLLKLLDLYHNYSSSEMKGFIRELVNIHDMDSKKNRLRGWQLDEAIYFATYQPETVQRMVLLNSLWYFKGDITGAELFNRINIIVKNDTEEI